MTEEVKYLIMVNPNANNNKFYRMIPHGNRFTVEYGRVGATGLKRDYPMSEWYSKYQEKIVKGYQDQTELHQDDVVEEEDEGYLPIEENSVRIIINKLREWANEKIKSSYTIKIKNVTAKMLQEAQEIINALTYTTNVAYFNNLLCDLYAVLPRKMTDVESHLAKTIEDFEKIVRDEQDLLDVMKGQVQTVTVSNRKKTNQTILDAMELEIRPCNEEEIANIKKHLTTESSDRFKAAWRVVNKRTETAFNDYCEKNHIKNIKLLYHGSRNENFWSILTNGMSLNPKAVKTGRMFGYGLYFATRAKKSIGYTSLIGSFWAKGNSNTGLLAVFKVAVGNPLDVYQHKPVYETYREKDIKAKHKDSLYAHAGISLYNDEIIVYNENAVTLRYLVELE